MGSKRSGFRVLDGQSPQLSGGPSFVVFGLDPATLEFSDIGGNPEQLLGFPACDWYGARFWSGRLHPDDREAARAFFADLVSSARGAQLEYRVIDAAGQTVWVHQIICVERDERQEVRVRGVLVDVTERRGHDADVERALFLKAEIFRIIVEELAPPVRAISVYGDMLGRHLAAQGDDVGSDYAVGLRGGLQRLDTTLGQLLRIAQSGGVSADDVSAGLAAPRRGTTAG
jgi:hypothetical protein